MGRRGKQLIYGLGYLACLGLIFFLLYSAFNTRQVGCFDNVLNQNETEVDCGGVCAPCALKQVRSISVTSVEGVTLATGNRVVLLELQNPNDQLGAMDF